MTEICIVPLMSPLLPFLSTQKELELKAKDAELGLLGAELAAKDAELKELKAKDVELESLKAKTVS